MIVGGRPEKHRDLFADGNIPDILMLVLGAWEKFPKPSPADLEPRINRRFRVALKRENYSRDLPFYIAPPEYSLTDSDGVKETGRIDIVLQDKFNIHDEVYFAFECKKLNVRTNSGFDYRAGKYVGEEGMMCFISGKYSADLPAGSMIGYVMDGDSTSAISHVTKAINRKRKELCLRNGSGVDDCRLVGLGSVKETAHDRASGEFTLYHIFLAV